MPSPKPAFAARRAATPQLVDKIEGQKIVEALHQRLAERAYALFEESGRQNGNDEKNWSQAKVELLQSLEMRKSGTWVALTASIPGASPESIQIYVETNRVIVKAEKAANAVCIDSRHEASVMFFAADFDVEVDPGTATAAFKNETLNLLVKKRRSVSATVRGDS
jgi:HSP20 family molecular chaperone IbpA